MTLYQHYKGGLYVVIDLSTINATNTNSPCKNREYVTYMCVRDDTTFIRESTEFLGNVEYKGKTGPRFRVIMDAADIMPEGGHP